MKNSESIENLATTILNQKKNVNKKTFEKFEEDNIKLRNEIEIFKYQLEEVVKENKDLKEKLEESRRNEDALVMQNQEFWNEIEALNTELKRLKREEVNKIQNSELSISDNSTHGF